MILSANTKNIAKAARILKRGGVVAFPTETVYGLGAQAFQPKAVCRVFEIKRRPSFDPLIVHVSSIAEARSLWRETPAAAKPLMRAFWPGPLTLVLPKKEAVPDVVTAGLDTVAVRMPANLAARRLLKALGAPIAAPSANLFSRTSPTRAADVEEDLGEDVDCILDGGPCRIGIESTVAKIEGGRVFILRPGAVTAAEIQKVSGLRLSRAGARLEAPGMMKNHYAPRTPLRLLKKIPSRLPKERVGLLSFGPVPDRQKRSFSAVAVLSARRDVYEAATKLFETMRKLDKMGLGLIVATPVPVKGIGAAVMDRLQKAAGGKFFKEK